MQIEYCANQGMGVLSKLQPRNSYLLSAIILSFVLLDNVVFISISIDVFNISELTEWSTVCEMRPVINFLSTKIATSADVRLPFYTHHLFFYKKRKVLSRRNFSFFEKLLVRFNNPHQTETSVDSSELMTVTVPWCTEKPRERFRSENTDNTDLSQLKLLSRISTENKKIQL